MKRALFQGWFTVGRDGGRAPRKMRCFDAPKAVRREEGAVVTTAAREKGSGAKNPLRGDGGGGVLDKIYTIPCISLTDFLLNLVTYDGEGFHV